MPKERKHTGGDKRKRKGANRTPAQKRASARRRKSPRKRTARRR